MARIRLVGNYEALIRTLILKKSTMRDVKEIVRKHGLSLQRNTQANMAKAYIHGYSTGKTRRETILELSNGGLTATVEPHTNYFKFIEYGTRKMMPMPTLHPAFQKEAPQFIKDVTDAVKK